MDNKVTDGRNRFDGRRHLLFFLGYWPDGQGKTGELGVVRGVRSLPEKIFFLFNTYENKDEIHDFTKRQQEPILVGSCIISRRETRVPRFGVTGKSTSIHGNREESVIDTSTVTYVELKKEKWINWDE